MTEEAEALFETRGPIGLVTLNRPKALNSLTLNMIRLIDAQLRAWAEDDAVKAIVLLGAGDKAFCAGGDVVSLAKEWDGVEQLRKDFFREEYILNTLIHTYPKPYIPLVDGISMGGGVRGDLVNPQIRLMRGDAIYGTSIDRLYDNPRLDTALQGGDRVLVEEEERYFLALGAAGQERRVLFPTGHVTALDALAAVLRSGADRWRPRSARRQTFNERGTRARASRRTRRCSQR